jgi:hypothetical protein
VMRPRNMWRAPFQNGPPPRSFDATSRAVAALLAPGLA